MINKEIDKEEQITTYEIICDLCYETEGGAYDTYNAAVTARKRAEVTNYYFVPKTPDNNFW